jgi:hypothetical protein
MSKIASQRRQRPWDEFRAAAARCARISWLRSGILGGLRSGLRLAAGISWIRESRKSLPKPCENVYKQFFLIVSVVRTTLLRLGRIRKWLRITRAAILRRFQRRHTRTLSNTKDIHMNSLKQIHELLGFGVAESVGSAEATDENRGTLAPSIKGNLKITGRDRLREAAGSHVGGIQTIVAIVVGEIGCLIHNLSCAHQIRLQTEKFGENLLELGKILLTRASGTLLAYEELENLLRLGGLLAARNRGDTIHGALEALSTKSLLANRRGCLVAEDKDI